MKNLTSFFCCFALVSILIVSFGQNNKVCTLKVATFNLRMDTPNDGENSWSHRKEMVKGLICFHDFDVFGTQEGFKHQLDDILELSNYAYVGVGRDDGKDAGEHSAIIYKTNRFKLIKSGNFWFSETMEKPSKGWDAICCNRICSWAKFKDINSGKEFFFFNSHFDHQGRIARKNSAYLLLGQIKKITKGLPVFCTGDFNATPNDEPIQIIYKDGKLKDSYLISKEPVYGTEGTFNSFNINSPMKNRIDYIWVNNKINVNKYGVLNEQQYGRFPSDHFPVMIYASF